MRRKFGGCYGKGGSGNCEEIRLLNTSILHDELLVLKIRNADTVEDKRTISTFFGRDFFKIVELCITRCFFVMSTGSLCAGSRVCETADIYAKHLAGGYNFESVSKHKLQNPASILHFIPSIAHILRVYCRMAWQQRACLAPCARRMFI